MLDVEKRVEELKKKKAELETSQAQQNSIDADKLANRVYSEISKIRDSIS